MNSRTGWGIVLILAGTLLLLDNVNVVDLGDMVSTFWPLLFIFWGAWILFRKQEVRKEKPAVPPVASQATGTAGDPAHASGQTYTGSSTNAGGPTYAGGSTNAGSLQYTNILGDYRVTVDSPAFTGGMVSTVFGDTEIDLTKAVLADGDHVLKTSGVFGTTKIRLDPGMEFSLSCNTLLGELELNHTRREGFSPTLVFQTPGFAGAGKRLRLIVSQVFGDVVVRN